MSTQSKMVFVFAVAVAAGGTYAALAGVSKSAQPTTNVATPLPSSPKEMGPAPKGVEHAAPAQGANPDQPEGDVLEVIDVQRYTYARIGPKGSEGAWVAVPTAKIAVGGHIKLRGAMMMANFSSPSLNRTFPEIWFGELDDGSAAPGAGAAGGAQGGDPHANPASSAPTEVKNVAKATGANAYDIGQILAQRKDLGGKVVRVRGVVVKANANILGKNYVHVRDGSAPNGGDDLTVTTLGNVAVGDTVLLEGTVGLDKDLGSGYKFATILEDAKIIP